MRNRFFFSSLLVCAALCSTACEGSRSLDSGLPDDQVLGTLSAPEMTQLCESTSDYFDEAAAGAELRHSFCILTALRAETVDACESALTTCLAEPAMLGTVDCSTVEPAPECDALVADHEACVTDQVEQWQAVGEGLDCSLVGTADLDAVLEARTLTSLPASCAALSEDPGCRTSMTE